jgi:hypothetical protein
MSCKRSSKTLLLVALLTGLSLAVPGWSQESRATLVGRVVDATDAVIVGARLKATNVETGVVAAAETNESGGFRIPYLLPGKYRLTAEKEGFKTYLQDNIQLRVNDSVDLTVRLTVGSLTETVTVQAEAALLETADSSTGSVIDERRLLELPQRGGNPLELERLSPGAVNLTTIRIMKLSSPDGTSNLSVNGSGNLRTQYNLDGVSNTTNDRGRGYGRVAFIPPSSGVTEFKMQGNPYDAAAGHVLGAVISVGTKSGSNELRGSLYYWARNSVFDSANFFDNKAGLSKLVYQDHRYGLTVGGPVRLPRLYNGRNKTFFFYSWEENRFGQPSTSNQTSSVPTAAERTGDFSALLALGSGYQIYNPFTTRAASTAGRLQRDPFAGNIIPRNLLNPAGLGLVSLYPLPNQGGTAAGQNNFYFPDIRQQLYDSHLARIDHAFSESHRAFLRLTHFGYQIPKDLLGVPATREMFHQFNRGVALDDVIVLSPRTVLNLRYGIVAAEFPEMRVTQGTDLTTLGFSPAFTKLLNPALAAVPRTAISGFATLSNWSDGDGQNTTLTHHWVADMTRLKGPHSFRFGADFRLFRGFATRYQTSITPTLSFANTYTRGPMDNSAAASLGQELAAALLGIPGGSMDSGPNPNTALQNLYLGTYFQDDFKVTPKLTLNLGLRYEYEWPITARFDPLVAGFAANTASPIAAQAIANYAKSPIPELPASAFAVNGGLTFANQGGNGRSPFKGNNGEWLPRLGLAYRLTSKTAIRSGYGIYFGSLGVDTFIPIQTGFSQSTPIQATLDSGITYTTMLPNPFPNGLLPALGAKGGLSTNLGQAISFFDAGLKQPYSQRWSFGVQRFLPGQFLLDVSYVANRATHLPVTQQINSTPAKYLSTLPTRDQTTNNSLTLQFPNPFNGLNSVYTSQITRAGLLAPYPQFGAISVTRSMGYSWYHALQARAEKRFSNGLSLQAAYTFSKFMQATEMLNNSDTRPYRVISDSDRPHVFTTSSVWEIPVGKGRRFGKTLPPPVSLVLGGWQLQNTIIRQAGQPLGFGSNALFAGDLHNIPLPKGQRDVSQWFNVKAGFNTVSAQQLVNNIITFPLRFSGVRSDGQATWNFSLMKKYKVSERLSVQFRAEVYNAMNHPSFDTPNTSPTSSTFGTVTAAVSEPRNWQFALKLLF